MNIVRLEAENIKRLTAVQITPDGAPMVVIAGENEAGKSSVLDAIAMALGGKALIPKKPIRDGQDHASVTVDLGDYIVTRTFTPSGGTSLKITNREGLTVPSPQAMLDGLVGTLTFDPLAFAEMDEDEQAATLRRLAGLNTTDLDTEYPKVFAERTNVNRDEKQLRAAYEKAPSHPGVGTEVVSSADVAKALEAAAALHADAVQKQNAEEARRHEQRLAGDRIHYAESRIEKIREELADAELELMTAESAARDAATAVAAATAAAAEAWTLVPDQTALRQQLGTIEATNEQVRANQRKAELKAAADAKKAESAKLTKRLNALEMEKAARLAKATFPVPELGLDATGVTWNGLPFAQASTAVRVRASVAIGLALNPKLKVLLIRNGNDLGKKNLHLIAEMAERAGAQVWIEKIDNTHGLMTVVIEDGAVAMEEVTL